jgi:hypothetical protein
MLSEIWNHRLYYAWVARRGSVMIKINRKFQHNLNNLISLADKYKISLNGSILQCYLPQFFNFTFL